MFVNVARISNRLGQMRLGRQATHKSTEAENKAKQARTVLMSALVASQAIEKNYALLSERLGPSKAARALNEALSFLSRAELETRRADEALEQLIKRKS